MRSASSLAKLKALPLQPPEGAGAGPFRGTEGQPLRDPGTLSGVSFKSFLTGVSRGCRKR